MDVPRLKVLRPTSFTIHWKTWETKEGIKISEHEKESWNQREIKKQKRKMKYKHKCARNFSPRSPDAFLLTKLSKMDDTYRVIKKSLCTWWLQYRKQVQKIFDNPVVSWKKITPLFSSWLHYMVICYFIFKKIKPLLKIGTTNLTLRPRERGAATEEGSLGKHTDRGVTQQTAEVCS